MAITDGSGLARQTRVPADSMVKMLRVAASTQHPELRGVITGLSVAGVEGSLRRQYFDDKSVAGRGVVRGKTGTLTGVSTLAGLVTTADGDLLAYAVMADDVVNSDPRPAIDAAVAALAGCGCR